MDIVRPKKTWTTKRLMTIAGITALVLLIAGSFYFTSGKSKLNVDLDRLTISTITKGPFTMTIPINGTVLPLTTIYLVSTDGGRVEQKYVDDGAILKAGDPILRLSNPDVEYQLAGQNTQVSTMLANMQLAKVNAEQNTVQKLSTMADVEGQFIEAERLYNVDKKLYAQKVIGSQEMQTATNNYNYLKQKRDLQQQILHQDTLSRTQEQEQDQESLVRAKHTLQILQQKVDALIIRAPRDGQLTALDAEIGQQRTAGYVLGNLDVLDGYKVRCSDIDEHYVNQVIVGQTGTFQIDTSTYTVKVSKVYTAVANARFQIDMVFVGKQPPKGTIRKGQTLQITLALSDETTAVLVPKGGFYQQTGGNWIFKVSADGKTAYRVPIQLGRMNIDYYEVIDGLKPGDKVITSSYETYGNIQELVLNK